MLWKRIVVGDLERILVAKNGRFHAILRPGIHYVFVYPGMCLEIERHDIRNVEFQSKWSGYLIRNRPDVVNRYFTPIETNEIQVGMVYADGKLLVVMTPAKNRLFWRAGANVTAEIVDVIAEQETHFDNLEWESAFELNSLSAFSMGDEESSYERAMV